MFNIARLILARAADPAAKMPVMAFLGDSITQGLFEPLVTPAQLLRDREEAYPARLGRMIRERRPGAEVEIINAGVGGNTAAMGLLRVDLDVLLRKPDFCLVCFGLNDVHAGRLGLKLYTDALGAIFDRLLGAGVETAFMTPNMMNTYFSPKTAGGVIRIIARRAARFQTDGTMDAYMDAAREAAAARGIPVCDCYARWQAMFAAGFDVTDNLANYVNHPARALHQIFAEELFRMLCADIVPAD